MGVAHAHRRWPRLTAVAVGLAVAVLAVAIAEVVLRRFVSVRGPGGMYPSRPDPIVGWLPVPDVERRRAHRELGGTPLFDHHYSTDSLGRRVTPVEQREARHTLVLLFGCSYTWGWGLEDEQTVATQLSRLAPDVEAFNYGVNGWGPQQVLLRLQRFDAARELGAALTRARRVIVLYLYLPFHVRRAIGDMRVVSTFGATAPFLYLDDRDVLAYAPTFAAARPVTARIYRVLAASAILGAFNASLPRATDAHAQFLARLADEMRRAVHDKLHTDEFYVVALGRSNDPVLPHLRERGVRVLGLHINWGAPGATLPNDGHPSAASAERIARLLADQLR